MNPPCIPLWSTAAPGARGSDPDRDVPTLTVYRPPVGRANGTAVVVCPGGGYLELMSDYEGRDFALWLNELGVSAFVLRYRLASAGYHHPAITGDVLRAIRCVRAQAAEWGVREDRIGVMGASAGGHLASLALTLGGPGDPAAADAVERSSARPDFGIVCYGLISMELTLSKNLLGATPPAPLVRLLSSDLQVTDRTPPCFLFHTADDPVVSAAHSLRFAAALQAHGVRYALHVHASGPHGLGLGVKDYQPGGGQPLHPWTGELARWLAEEGVLPAPPLSIPFDQKDKTAP